MESLIVSTLGERESTTTSSLRKLIHRLAEEHKLNQTMINPQMGSKEGLFRVALVLHDIDSPHIHNGSSLHAISHPISTCVLTNLVVLNEKDRDLDRAVKWLERQQVPNATQLAIGWGRQGFQELLGSDAIDAVYLVVPTRLHTQYTIPALESGRHVLLNDPESTSVGDFLAQLEAAKKCSPITTMSEPSLVRLCMLKSSVRLSRLTQGSASTTTTSPEYGCRFRYGRAMVAFVDWVASVFLFHVSCSVDWVIDQYQLGSRQWN